LRAAAATSPVHRQERPPPSLHASPNAHPAHLLLGGRASGWWDHATFCLELHRIECRPHHRALLQASLEVSPVQEERWPSTSPSNTCISSNSAAICPSLLSAEAINSSGDNWLTSAGRLAFLAVMS